MLIGGQRAVDTCWGQQGGALEVESYGWSGAALLLKHHHHQLPYREVAQREGPYFSQPAVFALNPPPHHHHHLRWRRHLSRMVLVITHAAPQPP